MWKCILLLLWLPCFASAQRISGYYSDMIRDQNGTPVSGASIVVKGTRTATTTDKNGYFKIQVTEGNIISVSYVGYTSGDIKITATMLQTNGAAQQKPVEAVLSKDYTALIQNRLVTYTDNQPDTIQFTQNKTWQLANSFYTYLPVKEISIHDNTLKVYQSIRRQLTMSGDFNATIELKNANRTPALQTQYVQGRPQSGALIWRGPETDEPFSFGPLIQSLEYDGSNYNYDKYGRLVATGSGNGSQANVYNNAIFQTGLLHSQSFNLNSSFIQDNERVLSFNIGLGQTDQSTIIRQNTNNGKNITTSLSAVVNKITITGTYNYAQDKFSNSNRNGFLNRVYQNAILTSVSFDNSQGYQFATGQRSYSYQADNPYFLLSDNGNSYFHSQNNAGLTLEKKQQNFSYKLMQSLETARQNSSENYKPGTAYFENGVATQRLQADKKYSLHTNAIYSFPISNYNFHSEMGADYNFNAANTSIQYTLPEKKYHYHRSSHDVAISTKNRYNGRNFEAGIEAANKFYFSNTAAQNKFFLPYVGVHVRLANLLDVFTIRASSSFNSFVSELPVNQSLAYTNLLQLSTQQSFQYFPVQEVSGYDRIMPVHHKAWTGRIEIDYKNKFTLSAETFSRLTENDIYPVYENGKLNLRNIAGHQNKGIEIELRFNDYHYYHQQFKTQHSLSFFSYRSRINTVNAGYNYLPVAGFSNVHKAVVKGEPLGVIVGNRFLRDINKNIIIGTDGFPLVNNQLQVIGNPIPDFVMKLNNNLQWKNLSLNIDWEWKHGGDIWNGTQATLDYYGRSQNSADLRNTTNYIFPGVMQNGQKNNVPVSFLHLNEPVQNNRWTRYGYSGVAEDYIQKADYLKINSLTLAYKFNCKKYIQAITLSAYVNNILLWSGYNGADPNQLLYDHPNMDGLDFFNLPSTKTFGFNASIQF